jgi:hypothetical protein
MTGSKIVVGAPFVYISDYGQGSAYVFVRNNYAAPYNQLLPRLTNSQLGRNDFFGWSVAISGYEVVVGAWLDDIGANANRGSAHVFVCNSSCGPPQRLIEDPVGHSFGYSVAIYSGTTSTVVVGDGYYGSSAYVFAR